MHLWPAAGNSCDTPGHFFAGTWSAGGSARYGVRAVIEPDRANLCGETSTSSAWVMLTGSGSGDGWAQIGYTHEGANACSYCRGGFHNFSQWTRCAGCTLNTEYYAEPSDGQNVDEYRVVYSKTNDVLRMVLNGEIKERTDFDPLAVWSTPLVSDLFGETWHQESDVPGTASDRVRFGQVGKMRWDETWVADDDLWIREPDVWRYHAGWVNRPTRFEIWTHPI